VRGASQEIRFHSEDPQGLFSEEQPVAALQASGTEHQSEVNATVEAFPVAFQSGVGEGEQRGKEKGEERRNEGIAGHEGNLDPKGAASRGRRRKMGEEARLAGRRSLADGMIQTAWEKSRKQKGGSLSRLQE